MLRSEPADVCIIGSGMAGALVAASCAQRGMRVVLLEAGPRYPLAERKAGLDSWLVTGHFPYAVHPGRDGFVNSATSVVANYPLNALRAKGVGGSTLHWEGVAERLFASDFRTATQYGLGTDWPLSYAELEPWYGRAEAEIGVSGEPIPLAAPRSTPFPMPAFPDSYDDARWRRVAERLRIQMGRAAYARNSVPYRGRSPCVAWGMCQVCPSGARYSADFHVELAERTGKCEVAVETVARRLEVDAGGTVRAVHATTLDGRDLEFRAARYVVAAHAIESARLLMLSGIGAHADQVGRHLMEHWYLSGRGLSAERGWPGRIGFPILESFHWYDGAERRDRGAIKLEFHALGDPLAALEATPPVWGRALAERDCASFGYWLSAEAGCEHQAHPESRVTLDPVSKDVFGDPVPNLHFVRDATDQRTIDRGHALLSTVLEAAGLREIHVGRNPYPVAHHMGTCRMSVDPAGGVVDRDLRVHGLTNLHVVGSSVFPTVGCVPPTLTIAALALRLGARLASRPATP
jgi:choline dehydrogenase-like flavoprotein